jgi:hypothetical protein
VTGKAQKRELVPPWHIEATVKLQEEVETMKVQLKTLYAAHQLRCKLALRQLLDDVRARLAGRPLTDAERGDAWNQALEGMADLKGLTPEAASLTKFGRGTQQWHSSKAAHDIGLLNIAEAVTSVPQAGELYKALFKFAYNQDADGLVFAD